jgi:lycopene beta-cyclase
MKRYDIAILGAGAAGLSLALALTGSPLQDKFILLVDKSSKDSNDRTWSYWTDQRDAYDVIRRHAWKRMKFAAQGNELVFELTPYRYQMVRGLNYYQHAREKLSAFTNVKWVKGTVESVKEGMDSATIRVDGEDYAAGWVFDSRILPDNLEIKPERFVYLKQHFLGWEVESQESVFDPDVFTMFDLCAADDDGFCFYYILPFSKKRALVEFTVFSENLWEESRYREALETYLDNALGAGRYQVHDEEQGVIPMTDHPFPRRLGTRVMSIGTLGGRVKPSTGFAFFRIQRDSKAIVRSLLKHDHPFNVPPDSRRRRFYDSLLLEVLRNQSCRAPEIFTRLFQRNPIRRILNFLDEKTTLVEEVLIIASLPRGPFLRALLVYLRKRITYFFLHGRIAMFLRNVGLSLRKREL